MLCLFDFIRKGNYNEVIQKIKTGVSRLSKKVSVQSCLKYEVVVLGGGFAGVYCAKALQKQLKCVKKHKVALIAEHNYMLFQPMLAEVVGSSLSSQDVVNPIRLLCKKSSVLKAEVRHIDLKKKKITISAGAFSEDMEVRFNHLVLAIGVVVDLSRVPGMPEHAFLMQNIGDALYLRSTILSRLEEANLLPSSKKKKRLLTFVVVGGGYSGVETAGQILDLLGDAFKYYKGIDKDDYRVVLIHSREHLLPTLSQDLGDYAKRKLTQRGLEVFLGQRVKAVTSQQVTLLDGSFIQSHTIISTVGNGPNPVITELCKNEGIKVDHGRIITDETMQVPGHDTVWAAGDCAAVPMPDGQYCAPTAQFAMRQGTLLGKNIASQLKGEPTQKFTFTGLGELAAIGHRTAVANILGLKFSGFFAWWMWRTIYWMKLPGLNRKIRVLIDWTFDLFFPRDISLLSPKFSKTLHEVHLEPGDILFNSGENAFSFYVIEKGLIDFLDEDGVVVRTIASGDFFGERALMEDKKYRYTAIAKEQTSLISLGSNDFKKVLEGSSVFRKILRRSAKKYMSKQEMKELLDRIPSAMHSMTVKDVMFPNVACADTSMMLRDAMDLLKNSRHSFYPFLDKETRQIKGMVSRNDFYNFVHNNAIYKEIPLEAIGLLKAYTLDVDTPILESIKVIVRAGTPKFVVVDKENKVQGMITLFDILDRARQVRAGI